MTARAPATQATIARAIRAAKREGARAVEVEGSTIRIVLTEPVDSGKNGDNAKKPVAKRPERLI
jgi:hypothetical protein